MTEGYSGSDLKITSDESWLSFDEEAYVLHNKVRAFSGWPGTRARVLVIEKNGEQKTLDIKIITTRLSSHESVQFNEADDVAFVEGALVFPCGRGTTLEEKRQKGVEEQNNNAGNTQDGMEAKEEVKQEKVIFLRPLNMQDFKEARSQMFAEEVMNFVEPQGIWSKKCL